MTDDLQEAIRLIKSGNNTTGGHILSALVKENPDNELAWQWLSVCVVPEEQKRYCLKQALRINPQNEFAKQALESLDFKPVFDELAQEPLPTFSQNLLDKQKSENSSSKVKKADSAPIVQPLYKAMIVLASLVVFALLIFLILIDKKSVQQTFDKIFTTNTPTITYTPTLKPTSIRTPTPKPIFTPTINPDLTYLSRIGNWVADCSVTMNNLSVFVTTDRINEATLICGDNALANSTNYPKKYSLVQDEVAGAIFSYYMALGLMQNNLDTPGNQFIEQGMNDFLLDANTHMVNINTRLVQAGFK